MADLGKQMREEIEKNKAELESSNWFGNPLTGSKTMPMPPNIPEKKTYSNDWAKEAETKEADPRYAEGDKARDWLLQAAADPETKKLYEYAKKQKQAGMKLTDKSLAKAYAIGSLAYDAGDGYYRQPQYIDDFLSKVAALQGKTAVDYSKSVASGK